jgi:hypothetical protein
VEAVTELTAAAILRAWLDRYDANDKAAAHGRPFKWDDSGNVTATSHNFDNVIPPMDVDEVEAVRAVMEENAAFRSGMVPRTLMLGLACVNCHKCVGVFVTQKILDDWARDNGWRDGWCPDCLAGPDGCHRCGGDPCTECGECPRQGCWECRCDQRDRDDEEREDEDDG